MELFHLVKLISTYFNQYLYLILFCLLFIEEAGVPLPVPGDIYTFLAGYQVLKHHANPFLIILDVTIASVLGASVLFFLVSKKGEPLVEKYGKYILLSPSKLKRGQDWFAKRGESIILLGRWVPGLRIVLTIIAGLLELKYVKFLIAITISTIVWSTAFLIAGIALGGQESKFLSIFKHLSISTSYSIYAGILVLVGIAFYFLLRGISLLRK